jgi:hypothetical protein
MIGGTQVIVAVPGAKSQYDALLSQGFDNLIIGISIWIAKDWETGASLSF